MRNPEKQNENLEQKSIEQTKDILWNFWQDPNSDKKFLENPESWKNAVNAIKDDINQKANSIKNPDTKALINEKIKSFNKYVWLWKLSQEQAQELCDIYKEITSIQWTEVKESNIQWEKYQEAQQKTKTEYEQKLLDAVEKLDSLLNDNNEAQQTRIKKQIEWIASIRNLESSEAETMEEFPPFPDSQEKNPRE